MIYFLTDFLMWFICLDFPHAHLQTLRPFFQLIQLYYLNKCSKCVMIIADCFEKQVKQKWNIWRRRLVIMCLGITQAALPLDSPQRPVLICFIKHKPPWTNSIRNLPWPTSCNTCMWGVSIKIRANEHKNCWVCFTNAYILTKVSNLNYTALK